MSPLPGTTCGAPRQSEGAKPQESRQSGDGPADPIASQAPETQAGLNVTPLKGGRVGPATTSGGPDDGGERSGGENPKKDERSDP